MREKMLSWKGTAGHATTKPCRSCVEVRSCSLKTHTNCSLWESKQLSYVRESAALIKSTLTPKSKAIAIPPLTIKNPDIMSSMLHRLMMVGPPGIDILTATWAARSFTNYRCIP